MTENDWTKLISIRLDKSVIAAMDKFMQRHNVYSRSSLINLILRQVLVGTNTENVWDFIFHDKPLKPCGTKN